MRRQSPHNVRESPDNVLHDTGLARQALEARQVAVAHQVPWLETSQCVKPLRLTAQQVRQDDRSEVFAPELAGILFAERYVYSDNTYRFVQMIKYKGV